jgi:hypothetical protein
VQLTVQEVWVVAVVEAGVLRVHAGHSSEPTQDLTRVLGTHIVQHCVQRSIPMLGIIVLLLLLLLLLLLPMLLLPLLLLRLLLLPHKRAPVSAQLLATGQTTRQPHLRGQRIASVIPRCIPRVAAHVDTGGVALRLGDVRAAVREAAAGVIVRQGNKIAAGNRLGGLPGAFQRRRDGCV